MAYESSVAFDGVVVIESLRKPAQLTGTDLFETTIAPAVLSQNAFAEIHRVSNRKEFFKALESASKLAHDGHSSILHLEMHGDQRGLQLTSSEMIEWSELAPSLSSINEQTKMNLLVVAATCHGWHLSDVLRPVDRAPAWGVIGPPDSVQNYDLYPAMQRFYATLWRRLNLREALNAANETENMADWVYDIQSADLLYCQVFRWYVQASKKNHRRRESIAWLQMQPESRASMSCRPCSCART